MIVDINDKTNITGETSVNDNFIKIEDQYSHTEYEPYSSNPLSPQNFSFRNDSGSITSRHKRPNLVQLSNYFLGNTEFDEDEYSQSSRISRPFNRDRQIPQDFTKKNESLNSSSIITRTTNVQETKQSQGSEISKSIKGGIIPFSKSIPNKTKGNWKINNPFMRSPDAFYRPHLDKIKKIQFLWRKQKIQEKTKLLKIIRIQTYWRGALLRMKFSYFIKTFKSTVNFIRLMRRHMRNMKKELFSTLLNNISGEYENTQEKKDITQVSNNLRTSNPFNHQNLQRSIHNNIVKRNKDSFEAFQRNSKLSNENDNGKSNNSEALEILGGIVNTRKKDSFKLLKQSMKTKETVNKKDFFKKIIVRLSKFSHFSNCLKYFTKWRYNSILLKDKSISKDSTIDTITLRRHSLQTIANKKYLQEMLIKSQFLNKLKMIAKIDNQLKREEISKMKDAYVVKSEPNTEENLNKVTNLIKKFESKETYESHPNVQLTSSSINNITQYKVKSKGPTNLYRRNDSKEISKQIDTPRSKKIEELKRNTLYNLEKENTNEIYYSRIIKDNKDAISQEVANKISNVEEFMVKSDYEHESNTLKSKSINSKINRNSKKQIDVVEKKEDFCIKSEKKAVKTEKAQLNEIIIVERITISSNQNEAPLNVNKLNYETHSFDEKSYHESNINKLKEIIEHLPSEALLNKDQVLELLISGEYDPLVKNDNHIDSLCTSPKKTTIKKTIVKKTIKKPIQSNSRRMLLLQKSLLNSNWKNSYIPVSKAFKTWKSNLFHKTVNKKPDSQPIAVLKTLNIDNESKQKIIRRLFHKCIKQSQSIIKRCLLKWKINSEMKRNKIEIKNTKFSSFFKFLEMKRKQILIQNFLAWKNKTSQITITNKHNPMKFKQTIFKKIAQIYNDKLKNKTLQKYLRIWNNNVFKLEHLLSYTVGLSSLKSTLKKHYRENYFQHIINKFRNPESEILIINNKEIKEQTTKNDNETKPLQTIKNKSNSSEIFKNILNKGSEQDKEFTYTFCLKSGKQVTLTKSHKKDFFNRVFNKNLFYLMKWKKIAFRMKELELRSQSNKWKISH